MCSVEESRGKILRPASRDPALSGSRFVGSRGVRNLYVCPECGVLWQSWVDQREGFRCWRAHGASIVPVFAASTSLKRLVDWTASHGSAGSFGLIDDLATRLIRRKPEGLQDGTSTLFRRLDELTPPNDAEAASRLSVLFHVIGLVVERVIRGDLRPKGPRVKPPKRYRDAEVEEAARHLSPRGVANLTRLPRTHDVTRRLMWESRWGGGAPSPDRAVIAISDLSPLLSFLTELPLEVVDDGVLRGAYSKTAFAASSKLHNLGRLPENDHAIWMPKESWLALEKVLDPLERLAASIRRIRIAATLVPSDCLPRLQMEAVLLREPIRNGARFTESARRELEGILRRLDRGRDDDRALSREALADILEQERAASESDARCVLAQDRETGREFNERGPMSGA